MKGGGVTKNTLMSSANDLRKGMAINYNGDIAVVLETQHRTPGNLRAFVQATLRSIKTGKASDVRFSSTEKIDVVPMMTRKMDFSYKDGDDFVFRPGNLPRQPRIPAGYRRGRKNFLVENSTVTITFVDEKAVSIEMPSSVILTVTDAPEGIEVIHPNNVQKPIILETGITGLSALVHQDR